MYVLYFATFILLALVFDPPILFSCWWATEHWDLRDCYTLLKAEMVFMFCFSKVVKLIGLFRKNPRDISYLPVSIIVGYFHGFIMYALFTLRRTPLRCFPPKSRHTLVLKEHDRLQEEGSHRIRSGVSWEQLMVTRPTPINTDTMFVDTANIHPMNGNMTHGNDSFSTSGFQLLPTPDDQTSFMSQSRDNYF